MQPILEKEIQKGEGDNQDFKQTITSLYKIAKTIVSFANTTGGKIFVGVSDKKTITGVDPEEEKYMINLAASQYCEPPIKISFQEEFDEEDEKTIVIATIQESLEKPHLARQTDDTWTAYIRVKDHSIPAGKSWIKAVKKSFQENIHKARPDSKLTRHEKALLDFLTINDSITLKEAMQLQNHSKRRAIRMLTALVSKNLIRVHEHEKERFWTI